MSAAAIKRNVQLVMLIYVAAIFLGVALRYYDNTTNALFYATYKDIGLLIVAIPAAWLGYCFQRRQSYLRDMHDLWSKMVAAVQDAIQYTHLVTAEQKQFGAVLRTLSIAIDEMRATFSNLGEDEYTIGLYPFESLKSIRRTVSSLGFGQIDPAKAALARCEIVHRWKELRRHFLAELERGIPRSADSPFLR